MPALVPLKIRKIAFNRGDSINVDPERGYVQLPKLSYHQRYRISSELSLEENLSKAADYTLN